MFLLLSKPNTSTPVLVNFDNLSAAFTAAGGCELLLCDGSRIGVEQPLDQIVRAVEALLADTIDYLADLTESEDPG